MSRCQSSLLDGFTDDWDAALLSEGTLRPRRAASSMNLREAMKSSNKSDDRAATKQDLENKFSRSMRLLGIENAECTSSKASSHKPKISDVSARTITRLKRPTVSYEDIRNAVTDGIDRKLLSQAAYERWYFRKMEEERAQRMNGLCDLVRNCNKLFHHGIPFDEWLEKKNKELKMKKTPVDAPNPLKSAKRKLLSSTPATKEAAEKAYKDWLNKKVAEETLKSLKVKAKLDPKSPTSREDAEKVFERWKTAYEEKRAKMKKRSKSNERKAKEKEEEEKERHQQDCEKAFNSWLTKKNQLIEECLKKHKKHSVRQFIAERKKQKEKEYEAKQAFDDWLEKKLELEASKVLPSEPKITKSIQTEVPPKTPTSLPKPTTACVLHFPKNLLVPWVDFTAKNRLSSPSSKALKKTAVNFSNSAESETDLAHKSNVGREQQSFSKNRESSDNKTIMMLYHKRDLNSALYYARDLS